MLPDHSHRAKPSSGRIRDKQEPQTLVDSAETATYYVAARPREALEELAAPEDKLDKMDILVREHQEVPL